MENRIKFAKTSPEIDPNKERVIILKLLRQKQENLSKEITYKKEGHIRYALLNNKVLVNSLYVNFLENAQSTQTLDTESRAVLLDVLREAVVENFTKSLNSKICDEEQKNHQDTMNIFKKMNS